MNPEKINISSLKEQELFYNKYWSELKTFSGFKVIRLTRIMTLLNEIRKTISYPRIIDLGCGDGRSVPIWSLFGKAIGFELSSSAVANAKQNFPFIQYESGNALDTQLPSGSVDVVISQEVIEHIENQQAYIKECSRLIADNGFLILTTPNKYYFDHTKLGNYSKQPIEKILLPAELKKIVEIHFKILKAETIVVAKGDYGIYRFLFSKLLVGILSKLHLDFIRQEFIKKQMLGVHICILARKL